LVTKEMRKQSDAAISMKGLTKQFPARGRGIARGKITAVDHITLDVARGELLGLLGPNGAGKTTTLLMLTTLLPPTSGEALVEGYDVRRASRDVRKRIGVLLTAARGVYERLTGRENLRYFGALYGVGGAEARRRAAALLSLVGLADRADDLVGRYSTGMRVRLALAKALLHDPPVLLLDEPTLGLDPHGARLVREIIASLTREGKTVILATHDMVEADRLSHRVAIIDHGRIVAVDAPANLKERVRPGEAASVTLEDVFLSLTSRRFGSGDVPVEENNGEPAT
jgi:ABC-2 type transport system ATP-binding protein